MGKQKFLFAFLILIISSCATYKKVQIIQSALTIKDTSQIQLIAEVKKVDSTFIVKEILEKIAKSKIDFKTMNAHFKVDYETSNNADSYIANISMLKDSQIFITIRGAMGVIGLKALVKKDSVVLYYPLRKDRKVEYKGMSYLQELLKIPINFNTIQDLILGNPIFMEQTVLQSYKITDQKLQVSLLGRIFKNFVLLNEDNTKVLNLKLDDKDINQHRTCDIAYSNHLAVSQYQFPMYRSIAVSATTRLDIQLEVKDFTFNEPMKYAFIIPKIIKKK